MSVSPPETIARVFDAPLARDPHHEALVTRSTRLDYAQLDELAGRAAGALWSLGIRPGDRVAVCLPNDVDVVAVFHGVMRLGAIWVGINRALAGPEKCFQIDDAGASLVVTDPPIDHCAARQIDLGAWRDAMNASRDDPPDLRIDPHAPAGIAYTSGTTGRPKGVVHSQANLLRVGAALVAERGYGPELRKGDCLPLTILNMQVLTTLVTAQAGGTCVVMDQLFASGIAEWIRRERVTTWNGPPALLHSLAHDDSVSAEDLSSLDEVWNGGADCPSAVRDAFEAKFRREILCTYGLTEAPAVVTIDPRGGPHHTGSSGRPLEHLRIEIRDGDGAVLASGETGEICVAAADARYRPMLEYWQHAEATAEVLAGGVLHTADVGYLDARGELHVRDRAKLVINRGGANVYPAEVERVLHEVDGVAACAVFGVADERLGERVVAALEAIEGAVIDVDAVRAHCEASLARYKVPERFVLVESFSRNAMGKILRADLTALITPTDPT